MEHILKKQKNRLQRKKRIRKKILGTCERPRMSIFKSLNHCYVQLIDDTSQKTILGVSTLSKELKSSLDKTGNIDAAKKLGHLVAEKALEKNISRIVFDRNGFLYHGRVKAIAEGAREKGLQF
ncbi:MAG: 50S ribosomal protein L18 [Pseudomonadota bacterium]